jgi:hypothetical protein
MDGWMAGAALYFHELNLNVLRGGQPLAATCLGACFDGGRPSPYELESLLGSRSARKNMSSQYEGSETGMFEVIGV